MDAHQEARIIALVQAGQISAFEQLVRCYQAPLIRIVGNLAGPVHLEDLVQEIFLAAFRHIRRYNPRRGAFKTWLYAIARNRTLNALKKKREQPLEKEPAAVAQNTPADAMLAKEIFQQLDQALDRLKFDERLIFVLAELEELPYGEIARIAGVPLGTVKSRLARTKAKLRHHLKQYVN